MVLTNNHIITLRDFNLTVKVKVNGLGSPRTGKIDLNYQCKKGNVLVLLDPVNQGTDKPTVPVGKIKQAIISLPSALEVVSIEGKLSSINRSDRLLLETIFKDRLKETEIKKL